MAEQRKTAKARGKRRSLGTQTDSKRPLLPYLKGALASLNGTDRLIANYVLADPEKVVTSAIAEVKKGSGASVGAIVGFCQRLGMKGFADFKIALARDLAQSGLSAGEDDQAGTLFEKVFRFHQNSLAETLTMNPESELKRVVQSLDKANKIELFSIGLSYPVAYTASCKFLLIGLPASTQYDSHMQLINATQLKAGDVAFGISSSGTTKETVQCLQTAKGKGASTICLTNAMNSPITEYSDFVLFATPSEIKYFQAPLASRVTQLAVLDALFVALALKHKNRTAKRLQTSSVELRRWQLD